MELKKSETLKNLARAFAGECQAGARYQFLRKKCMQKQMTFLANVLKMLATNEMAHAKIWWDFIVASNDKKVVGNIEITSGYPFKEGEFEDEFKYNMENEKMEANTIYPEFAKVAKKEGFDDIAAKFEHVALIENCHAMVFEQISQMFEKKVMFKSAEPVKWKCQLCGYEHTSKDAWKTCPVCGAPQGAVQIQLNLN